MQSLPAPSGLTRPAVAFAASLLAAIAAALALASAAESPSVQATHTPDVYRGLLKAASKGSYFLDNIKDCYPYAQTRRQRRA